MGPEMMNDFRKQAERFGTRFITDDVTELKLTDGDVHEVTVGKDTYRARAVILAMGAEPKRLGIPGEMELQGLGVSTCGVCDGAFFKGKDVAVIGGGDSAMEDSIFVSKFADKLTIVHRRPEFRASQIMEDRARGKENIEVLTPYKPVEFVGGEDKKIESIRLENTETGEEKSLPVGGAFVAIGHTPRSELVVGQVDTDEEGYVKVDEPSTKTKLAGVFAIGDLVDNTYRQAVTAAGSGTKGALDAEWYLRDTPGPDPEAHWGKQTGEIIQAVEAS
jgi:thioredoxin reductase (NADPH)